MATNKYTDIEIQTAKILLEHGYKWIVRNRSGKLLAYHSKPSNRGRFWASDEENYEYYFCDFVPIFLNISIEDSEPVSLESIVHPQILDDAERKYLSAVIKPFRNKVQTVRKFLDTANGEEYIVIDTGEEPGMFFPDFEANTMYKGMVLCKDYTLEELGL